MKVINLKSLSEFKIIWYWKFRVKEKCLREINKKNLHLTNEVIQVTAMAKEAQRKLQPKELLIPKKFLFGDRNFRKRRFEVKISNQYPNTPKSLLENI